MPLQTNKTGIIRAAEQALMRAQADAARVRLQLVPAGMPARNGHRAVELTPAGFKLFQSSKRYLVDYGGRGAGRSWDFGRALIARCYERPTRALLAREYMNSLADSAQQLVADQIAALGLGSFFDVQGGGIYGTNGSQMTFAGLKTNISKLKSAEGLDIVWIEEAEHVSKASLRTLIPTIRKPGSQLWFSFNPDLAGDPVYQMFVANPRPDAEVIHTTWRSNPWFPDVLCAERDYLARVDPDAHAHVWEGQCRTHSDAQIFKDKYVVEPFEPQGGLWDGPYYGADWGFAKDPTVLVKLWIFERKLYIEHEAYGVGIDIDKTPALFDTVPGARNAQIRADSARPETISFMKQHGFPNTQSVQKWSGSVEDGVAHMRSYEQIVVHPRCRHAAEEMRLYSFKVDRLSGDVMPEIVDAANHVMDACRYGLQPLIRGNGATGYLQWLQREVAKQGADEAAEAAANKRLPFQTPDAKVSDM